MAAPSLSEFPATAHSRAKAARWMSPASGALVIVLMAVAAYCTSFGGVFVFDDGPSLLANPTLDRLWPLTRPLSPPPGGLTVSGRPVLNLSFALNHAISGTDPWSYHALNLAIHALAGLALFGLVRRTLQLPSVGERWRSEAGPLALAVALLWTVHPLQTQTVTYVVQRAESLMGLFYLLTLYAFLRAATSAQNGKWGSVAVASCLLGMGTKEVMVTVPLMVFLFDRCCVGGTFAEAWRRRWPIHVALLATWLPLAWLILSNDGGTRGGTAGFGVGVAWWSYGLTQFVAMVRYLQLALWPYPLVFEYGTFWVASAGQVLPYAAVVLPLVGVTFWALWRRPVIGFLGAWFLGILAPTSLAPGTLQMIVEHRMYLPLAAVLVAGIVGLRAIAAKTWWLIAGGLVVAGAAATARRNLDYHSVLGLWADTVEKRPANAFARNNFGNALADAGQLPAAVAQYEEAVRLAPGMAEARYNLGSTLTTLGRAPEAWPQLVESLRIRPGYGPAEAALGDTLVALGRLPEAIEHYQAALRAGPDSADVRHRLGATLARAGQLDLAIVEFERVLAVSPDNAEAHTHLGNALADTGQTEAALTQFRAAIRLAPRNAFARYHLANTLLGVGRVAEAVDAYEAALQVGPGDAELHNNFGVALVQAGRLPEARRHFEEALRLRPDFALARTNLDALSEK